MLITIGDQLMCKTHAHGRHPMCGPAHCQGLQAKAMNGTFKLDVFRFSVGAFAGEVLLISTIACTPRLNQTQL